MSEQDTRVPGSGQPVSQSIIPPIAQAQAPIDPKAKAFTDKLMELIGEVYTLSLEIASIDDPNLLNHPVVKQARKVVAKVKELKDVLGTK
jgi:hypothetical protein